jgi:hypothetical protein
VRDALRRRPAAGGAYLVAAAAHEDRPTIAAVILAAGMMTPMDRSVAWRAALLQALSVTVVAVALGLALPRSFLEDWGWLAGPGAWGACALVAGAVLRLPLVALLVGAALSGLPMLFGVAVGVHWLGAPLALALFGTWCGRLAWLRRPVRHVAA